jgi:hypothetical protein
VKENVTVVKKLVILLRCSCHFRDWKWHEKIVLNLAKITCHFHSGKWQLHLVGLWLPRVGE